MLKHSPLMCRAEAAQAFILRSLIIKTHFKNAK